MTRRSFLSRAFWGTLALSAFPFLRPHASAASAFPYLCQLITKDPARSRRFLWQVDSPPSEPLLEVKATDGQVQSFPASVTGNMLGDAGFYLICADATGLVPATAYEYRLRADGNVSSWLPFRTAPVEDGEFSALLFDDSQCVDYTVWGNFLQRARAAYPEAELYAIVGDLVDNGAALFQWRSFLEAMAGTREYLPLAPVMGNHECYGMDWKNSLPTGYLALFPLPDNGSPDFRGYYYSFDYGSCHFIALNTQFLELEAFTQGLRAEQLLWLKHDVESSTRPWNIVLMHKDILAYDEYQAGTQTSGGFSDAGSVFRNAFDALGIDLVLTGHMHTYRNRGHIYAGKGAEHGPYYIMFGPSGDQHYSVPSDPLDLISMAQDDPNSFRNYLALQANKKTLSITCRDERGTIIDSVTLTKESEKQQ